MTMRITEKTGNMIALMEVVDKDDLIVITNKGVLMRQHVDEIRTIGRVTQGVKLVKLDEGSTISSITRVIQDESVDNSNEKSGPEEPQELENEPRDKA